MSVDIKVPTLPESVADAVVAKWYIAPGEAFIAGQPIVDLETDKVTLEVPAPEDGVLDSITQPEGSEVVADQVLGQMTVGAAEGSAQTVDKASTETRQTGHDAPMSPSVRRMIIENGLDVTAIQGSGKGGRVTKEDVQIAIKAGEGTPTQHATPPLTSPPVAVAATAGGVREETRVPMSRMRQRVAERLLGAQHEAAMLTTFNEVDMQPVMDLRAKYKESFEKAHGVRLGFMSFFVKAVVAALRRFPDVNAYLDGQEIVYHSFQDVGMAVGSEKGLVVPILRNAETMTVPEIEKQIMDFKVRAQSGKITLDEMLGGTFTITNGGVFGSMLSTPIINPPQSAILGMHNIVKRPVVVGNEIVIRPMMYLALSYDHRMIDGSTSVRFLVAIKNLLEDPARLILDV